MHYINPNPDDVLMILVALNFKRFDAFSPRINFVPRMVAWNALLSYECALII
jgi:hypothetical protein